MTKKPDIHCERFHATLGVSDLHAALAFYTNKLGFGQAFTWGEPLSFAGVNLGKVQIFLDTGEPNTKHALNFVVDDADALYEFHTSNGVDVVEPIAEREYGLRDYMVRDPDGNLLGFGHYSYSFGEPLEIERVEMPIRIEKRQAALLQDLAEYKRMSLSSLLEEILLHTSEREGDGVASPHTLAQLNYIQDLKRKHGIDYDAHASYRFVETQK
jgi:catechol 2,3-dioxygenase-like lactoylglutathione lyase family enzyme